MSEQSTRGKRNGTASEKVIKVKGVNSLICPNIESEMSESLIYVRMLSLKCLRVLYICPNVESEMSESHIYMSEY